MNEKIVIGALILAMVFFFGFGVYRGYVEAQMSQEILESVAYKAQAWWTYSFTQWITLGVVFTIAGVALYTENKKESNSERKLLA